MNNKILAEMIKSLYERKIKKKTTGNGGPFKPVHPDTHGSDPQGPNIVHEGIRGARPTNFRNRTLGNPGRRKVVINASSKSTGQRMRNRYT